MATRTGLQRGDAKSDVRLVEEAGLLTTYASLKIGFCLDLFLTAEIDMKEPPA